MQQLRAERDDPVALLECARHACAVVIHMLDRDRPPSHLGQIACDDPYAGPLPPSSSAPIGTCRPACGVARASSGMRIVTVAPSARRPACLAARSALRTCAFAHPRYRRAGAASRGHASPACRTTRPAPRSRPRAQGFRQLDHGFPAAGVREPHDRLAGAHDLAGLRERVHHDAVAVRDEFRIAGRIARDAGIGLGGAQLGFRGIGRCLDLVIGRCRYRAGAAQVTVARFVLGGLPRTCPCRGHGSSRARAASFRSTGSIRISGWPRRTVCPVSTSRSSTLPDTRNPRSLCTRAATVPVNERDAARLPARWRYARAAPPCADRKALFRCRRLGRVHTSEGLRRSGRS